MTTAPRRLALLAAAWVLTACGTPGGSPDPEQTAVDRTPSTSPSTRPSSSPSSSLPAGAAVTHAVADLAASLGVDPDTVEVVAVEDVTWRDGSRGCAEPEMAYTQAVVEGSRITLRVGSRTYAYHAGTSGRPTRCDHPTQ